MSKLTTLSQRTFGYKALTVGSFGIKSRSISIRLLPGSFVRLCKFTFMSIMQLLFASAVYPVGQAATQSCELTMR